MANDTTPKPKPKPATGKLETRPANQSLQNRERQKAIEEALAKDPLPF